MMMIMMTHRIMIAPLLIHPARTHGSPVRTGRQAFLDVRPGSLVRTGRFTKKSHLGTGPDRVTG